MRLLLEEVREAPVEWQEELVLTPEQIEGSNLLGVGPVECRGRLTAVEDGILIEGDLRYEQTMACDRCLEPTALPAHERFQLLAVAALEEPEAVLERELEKDELDVVGIEGEEIDTDPLVVEQVRLNVPMKPLCSEQCKGLCPRCGSNLNEGPCHCRGAEVDPRWAALAELRDSEETRH